MGLNMAQNEPYSTGDQREQPDEQVVYGTGKGQSASSRHESPTQPTNQSHHGNHRTTDSETYQSDGGTQYPTSRASGHKMQRTPTGVKLICALFGLFGSLLVFLGQMIGVVDSSAGGLITILGIGYFVVIYGLWNLEAWGWYAATGLLGLTALASLSSGDVPGLMVSSGLIWYLWAKRSLYEIEL